MADTTRNIFSLSEYSDSTIAGDGVPINDVWTPPAPIPTSDNSYFVGGLYDEWNTGPTAKQRSITEKVTYTTSTTARLPSSNLPNQQYGGVGMSSLLAMYSGGGPNASSPNQTNVYKLTYATESWASQPAANDLVVEPKESTQGVSTNENGYFFAGYPGTTSYTQKYSYSTETASQVSGANLDYDTYGASAGGNQTNAYVSGGTSGGWSSFYTNVNKFTYSDETMVRVPALNLSDDKYKGLNQAVASNAQYLWLTGGYQTTPQGGAIIGQTTVAKINMSVDSIQHSLPSTQLPTRRAKHGGVNNGIHGYFAGGNSWNNGGPAGPGGPYNTTDKLTFANDTMAYTPGANLTVARSLMQTAGPRQDGMPSPAPGGPPVRWVDGADGKANAILFNGSSDRLQVTGWNSNSVFSAYAMTFECWVKFTGSDGTLDTIWDNRSSTSSNDGFLIGRFHTAGHENKIEMFTNNDYRITTDVEVPNDVWTHVAYAREGNNETARLFINGVEAGSYTDPYNYDHTGVAYVGCNSSTTYYLEGYISNIRFVKGTAAFTQACLYKSNFTVPTAPLTNTSQGATPSVSDYGTKLIMCNESSATGSTVTADSLSIAKSSDPVAKRVNLFFSVPPSTPSPGYNPGNYALASGTPNHGYYLGGGGYMGPTTNIAYGNTNSMKMSFATDTLASGVQLSQRYYTGGMDGGKTASSPTHAYAINGRSKAGPGAETGVSVVRKIQYTNDTASTAPNSNATSYGAAIAGSTTNVYMAGGTDNANIPLGRRTGVMKMSYSNDTWSQISQSNANYSNPSGWPRGTFASGGTQEYALWSMGQPSTYSTSISKFTYATDTGIFTIPGQVYPATQQKGAVGNSNDTHWYMARGNNPSNQFQSNISKFTFATNTWEFGTLQDNTFDYANSQGVGAINNGMFAGYWAGGHYDQQDATSTMKLTYTTETITRGPNIPSGRYTPSASNGGGGNGFSGTSVQEWGAGGTEIPNVI